MRRDCGAEPEMVWMTRRRLLPLTSWGRWGKIGTEVAKEASDIVLFGWQLRKYSLGAEEGRGIYKTIKKVILYLFSTSNGRGVHYRWRACLGYPLPLSPLKSSGSICDWRFSWCCSRHGTKRKELMEGKFDGPKMDCGRTYGAKNVLDGITNGYRNTLSFQGILWNWYY